MTNLSEDELQDLVQRDLADGPQPGERYRYYLDGELYLVVCRSIMEPNFDSLVTYRSNAKNTYWTRTVENFTGIVPRAADNPKGPCPRFRREPD